jgi:hypothetical protein
LIFSVILSWYVEAIFAVSTRSKRILLMFIRSLVSNDQIELKSIRLEKVEAFKIQRNLTPIFQFSERILLRYVEALFCHFTNVPLDTFDILSVVGTQ